jgi:hypothetical protein
MLIVEELFLIGIDEGSKKNELKSIPFLSAGAILYDLKAAKIISLIQPSTLVKGVLVHLEKKDNTGNALLDEAISEISSSKKDRPVAHWLSKFKGNKYEKLVIRSLSSLNQIKVSDKNYEIINSETKDEILNNVIKYILQEQEPDDKSRALLMLLSLRSANWEVLSKKVDVKDEKIKNRLVTFQKMNWEDQIGYYLKDIDPGMTFL